MKTLLTTLMLLLLVTPAIAKEETTTEENFEQHYGKAPSLNMLRDALKPGLRDPDSLRIDRCTKPEKSKRGWKSFCRYRAKNGFGGYASDYNLIVIRNGKTIWVGKPPPNCNDEWNKEHLLACQPGQ